jgi:hypothetical protein
MSLARSILPQIPDGSLLQEDLGELPLIYRDTWPLSSAQSFQLQST